MASYRKLLKPLQINTKKYEIEIKQIQFHYKQIHTRHLHNILTMEWESIKSGDLAAAWKMVRMDLGRNLFPGQLVVVPNLQDAAFYNLMVSFTKCKVGVLDKLAMVRPAYQLHGHIADLVDVSDSNMSELLYMCQHPVREEVTWPHYSRTWSKGKRSVTVELAGLTKLVANWTIREGGLVLDTGLEELEGVRKVYIISEVVYAETIRMEVDTGERRVSETLRQRLPVAFSYFKFPVSDEGVVQAARGRGEVDKEAEFLPVGEVDGEESARRTRSKG